jgi:hypothetical protein
VKLEFEWQVGDRQGEQETLARIRRRRSRFVPRWVWLVVAFFVVCLGAGAYVLLRQRYEEAEARVAFQTQAVIDLEASAYARGDAELYLEQQDWAARDWYGQQTRRVSEGCFEAAARSGGSPADDLCEPVLPATVQEVELRRDIAWVEVIEAQPPVRRVRFYRQTDLGWKQTAPEATFWGTAVEVHYGGDLVLRYHRRDRPHVQPAVERIVEAFDQTCATFGCALDEALEVNFVIDMPRLQPPELQNGRILLPSPWIAGIPVDGGEAPRTTDYAYLIAYELTLSHLAATVERPLSSFELAMAGEYAAWQAAAGPGHAPLVDRLVERRGPDALPAVFASLDDVGSLNLLMVEWLGLSASTRPSDYFETLVNLEQQALAAGRKETFLLLQDETIPGWLDAQESFFERTRMQALSVDPVRVQDVDLSGELARVTLDRSTAVAGAHPLAPRGQVVYFRRLYGDWKHTSPQFTQADLTRSAWLPASQDMGAVSMARATLSHASRASRLPSSTISPAQVIAIEH